mmetsp:Transcript_13680/g.29677  ORF Transcript_13680/g.29677 Transcript_13680/m.29677 type:complete len:349 (+) Transcript_13680:55-1101(+)
MPPTAAIGRRGLDALRRSTLLNLRLGAYATSQAHPAANARNFDVNYGSAHANLTHHRSINTHHTAQRRLSSPPSPPSPPPNLGITTNLTADVGDTDDKSIFSKLWDKYSFEGQKKRIILGERLFRSAQYRASDPRWFQEARIPYEFRPRHALLTMHVWFLHKRLLADRVDSHLALLVQEELFDILWNDTRARIRAEGVNELTVNKHLKDAQQLTFLHCTHYDHAFQEFAEDHERRFEEIAGVIWTYVLNQDEEAYNEQVKRLVLYVEYQYANLLHGVPDSYFWEGRIPWGDIPEFRSMKDNAGKDLEEVGDVPGLEMLPKPWRKTMTDAGDTYYWNTESNQTTWKKPM